MRLCHCRWDAFYFTVLVHVKALKICVHFMYPRCGGCRYHPRPGDTASSPGPGSRQTLKIVTPGW